jgi:Zn-dependent protease
VFGRSFRIATVAGIPVNVDASWIWIAALALIFGSRRLQLLFPIEGGEALLFAAFGAVLFFGSVFLHELAHAVTARLSHIRVEGITLVFFGGFTAAHSEEKGPGPAFAIAALGPATSLALGGLLWWASGLVDGVREPVPSVIGFVGRLNLLMAGFNVLPGLPLDGGRMLQATVWRITGERRTGTTVAARTGMAVGIALGVWAITRIAQDDVYGAIWIGVIALFIFQAAAASDRHSGLGERLRAGTVADVMEPPPPAVPADLSLSETLDRYLRGHEDEAFPVLDGEGAVIGVVSFTSARELGARDPLRPVRDALIPIDQVLVTHPEEPLDDVTRRLGTGRAALVLRDGRLVGAVNGGAVVRWISSRTRPDLRPR